MIIHLRSLQRRYAGSIAVREAGLRHCSSSASSPPLPPPLTSSGSSSSSSKVRHWGSALPDIAYGFPANPDLFAAEQSGTVKKEWLQSLPNRVEPFVQHHLPNKDDFWRSPPYEALQEIVRHAPYHDSLKLVMEHHYTFLFAEILCAKDAPMPHVMYEDFMQTLTFSSLQNAPEEQFALPDDILRDLLCMAATYCTIDRYYFTSAAQLYRKIEQQQHVSPAVQSAWIYVCIAGREVERAVAYAASMADHGVPFHEDVFAALLHPSLSPVQRRLRDAPQTARSMVLQRRLCRDMNQQHGPFAAAVHALFVYSMLTLQQTQKWEVLRSAAARWRQRQQLRLRQHKLAPASQTSSADDEVISGRTMQLALHLFVQEKGIRWGPQTVKAMLFYMAGQESTGCTAAEMIFVLLRILTNEQLSSVAAALPKTSWTPAEQEEMMAVIHRRSAADLSWRAASPIFRQLLSHDGKALQSGMQMIQQLATAHERLSSDATVGEGPDPLPLSAALDSKAADLPCSVTASTDGAPSLQEAAADLVQDLLAIERQAATGNGTSTGSMAASSVPRGPPSSMEKDSALLQQSLERLGATASLTSWSKSKMLEGEEEARLAAQVQMSWISPLYRS